MKQRLLQPYIPYETAAPPRSDHDLKKPAIIEITLYVFGSSNKWVSICCKGSHSAAVVKNLSTQEKYVVNYGYFKSSEKAAANKLAKDLKSEDYVSTTIYGQENGKRNFQEFKKIFDKDYYSAREAVGTNFNMLTHNCAHATQRAILFFQPAPKPKKALESCLPYLGIFNVCAIRSCPLPPGIQTPFHLYDQVKQSSSSVPPATQKMTDHNPIHPSLSRC